MRSVLLGRILFVAILAWAVFIASGSTPAIAQDDDIQAVYQKAKQGDVTAQFILGLMYAKGQGVKQDYTQARLWFQKAAEQGNTTAQYNLGTMYKAGQGGRQDDVQARLWFQKAAEQGNGYAQFDLGMMYDKGEGGKRDYAKAAAWYQKAAEHGHTDAQKALDNLNSAQTTKSNEGNTGTSNGDKALAQVTDTETRLNNFLNSQDVGRFKDNNDGTVTDTKTGLIWLENANCFDRQNWNNAAAKAAELSSGACGLSDGSYTGQWRLPSRKELGTLVFIRAEKPPALPSNHPFKGVQFDIYWSSTSTSANARAWTVDFSSGFSYEIAKHFTSYVWPVRGNR